MPYKLNHAAASVTSLISTPSSVESSNPFTRLAQKITDPYREDRASKVFARAKYEMLATDKLLEEDRRMPPDEKEVLETHQDDVATLSEQYCRAKANKDGKACRKVLPRMEEEVTNLNMDRTASTKKARERTRLNQAYTLISERSKDAALLTSPRRRARRCETAVRIDVLKKTTVWLTGGHERKRIHWLQGKKGSGKSTLLRWIADRFIETRLKLPSWVVPIAFDVALNQAEPFVNHFLPTVLHHLANHSAELKRVLCKICSQLNQDHFFASTPFPQQVRTLFGASMARVLPREDSAPVLIILDGLDECNDGTLDCLFSFIELALTTSGVPVYFILASTGEHKIRQYLEGPRFAGLVDVNEVEDYPSARAKAASWVPPQK